MRHQSVHEGRRRFLEQMTSLVVAPAMMRAQRGGGLRPSPALTAIEKDIPAVMERFSVPGLALAVIENGRLVPARGFGVRKAGAPEPVSADTVFEAASLGKPPFAYAALKLAELKQIDLDAGLGAFFREPDFRNDATVDAITPRRVLSHQTGLLNWRPAREPQRFQFAPGAGFSYSGEAYVRLQRYVEKAAGASLADLSSARLFDPWGMTNSSYIWREAFARTAAEGHNRGGEVVRTRLWGYSASAPQARRSPPGVDIPLFAVPNAAASLYTTANDYARFLEGLLAPPAADASHVTRATLDAMFSPAVKVNDELSWGLGWGLARVRGDDTFWHWGNNEVYQGFVVGSRARRWGAAIFTNSANGLRACREIVTRLLGEEHPAFRWETVLPRE